MGAYLEQKEHYISIHKAIFLNNKSAVYDHVSEVITKSFMHTNCKYLEFRKTPILKRYFLKSTNIKI